MSLKFKLSLSFGICFQRLGQEWSMFLFLNALAGYDIYWSSDVIQVVSNEDVWVTIDTSSWWWCSSGFLAPCELFASCQSFRENYWLHLQFWRSPKPRRKSESSSPRWKPHISHFLNCVCIKLNAHIFLSSLRTVKLWQHTLLSW